MGTAVVEMDAKHACAGVRDAVRLRGRPVVAGLVLFAVSLVVAAVLPHSAVALLRPGSLRQADRVTAGQPLSAALAAGGKLGLKNGSFDARGYRMTFARDGAPRFVNAAVASDVSWSDRFGNVGQPAESSGLSAVAVSGADVYVGGTFTALNSQTPLVSANHVAHWNGRGWSALGTPSANGVNGIVRAIAVSGASVYVGGDFTKAGGVPASHVARWTGSGWSALGGGVTNTAGSSTSGPTVSALTVSGSILYVGGTFDDAGPVSVHSIASWNGTTWSAVGTGVLDCCGGAGSIKAIVVSGSNVYAGGYFARAGSVLTSGVARWNGTGWSALPVGGIGAQTQFTGQRGTVNALALSASTLYAGGDFASISGVKASSVASWNGTSWHPLGTGMPSRGGTTVQALAVFAGKLFAGGTFTDAGGDGQPVIAQWNGAAWSPVGAGLNSSFPVVNALAVSPSGVVAGGLFGGSGTTTLANIGTWTGVAWTGFGLGPNSGLTTVAASGRDLYAGGFFSTAGSTAASEIAHFSGLRWDAMGGGVTGGVPFAIAIDGSQVYVGGAFSQAGTVATSHIAMWDGSAWHALGSGTDGLVRTLLVYNGKLWVGGTFSHAGGVAANNMATWNLTTHVWAPVGGNLQYDGSSPPVNALSGISDPANPANNHFVMIGGGFSSITDGTTHVTVNSVLMFDTTAPTPGPFSGYYKFLGTAPGSVGVTTNCGSGCPGTVSALYADGLSVYVGGDFDVAGSVASRGFALLNIGAASGNGWSSPGVVGGSIVPATVQAITKVGSSLYLGGDFSSAGSVLAADVAQYTPATHTWAALGSGLGEASFSSAFDGANALASSTDGLYVGGGFSTAGAKPSPNLALWTATAAAPTLTSFTPTSGKAGVTQVTITGNSFWGATAVTFNGRSGSFKILSGTQITAAVPIAATSGKLTITTPRGTATSALSFTVTP